MTEFLLDQLPGIAIGAAAVAVPWLALWLRYRAGRRQEQADAPQFVLKRAQGQNRFVLSNSGRSTAQDVSVRTKRGSFVKWSNQCNKALRRSDGGGGFVGGEEPWTTDCSGETRNLEPGDSKELVLSENAPDDEVLIVSGRNYMSKPVKVKRRLKEIYWE